MQFRKKGDKIVLKTFFVLIYLNITKFIFDYLFLSNLNKEYTLKVNKDIDRIYFLYGGDMINKEAQLSQFVKGDKEIVIVVLLQI